MFGLSAGPAPDRFLVGLATLTLLAEAAEQQPLVCIVDDAQWLDQASAQILAFVARRLLAERVALVCAARTGIGDDVLAGLPALSVGGLGDSDARALLLGNVHGPLDAAVCDQIVAESHGNPLALLELPRTWRRADLAGGFGLPGSQPVAGKIEQSYVRRLQLLPPDTQLLVLAAAAEPLGDPVLLHRAADDARRRHGRGRPRRGRRAAPGARARGVRPSARPVRRLPRGHRRRPPPRAPRPGRGHRRREATRTGAPGTAPAPRAGPDEEVAAELERSAGRAQARGGLAAAAAFLTRAAELTPVPAARARRALAAAFANVQAGALRRRPAPCSPSPATGRSTSSQRAQIDLLRAQLAFASSRGNEATPLLLAAAQRLEPLDPELARADLPGRVLRRPVRGPAQRRRRHRRGGAGRPVRAAPRPTASRRRRPAAGRVRRADRGLRTRRFPLCRDALRRLRSDTNPARERLRWLWQGCVLALELWDDESAYVLSDHHLQVARKTGALSELPLALGSHTPVLVFCGELAAAAVAGRGGTVGHGGDGYRRGAVRRVGPAAWQGQAREARTDRRHDARGELPRRGSRRRHLRVLARRPVQRPRASTTRR